MNASSSSSSGPGLERIASGTATLPTSCSSAARATVVARLGVQAHRRRERARELRDRARVGEQLRLALADHAQQHVAALARRRVRAALLLGVHAAVGELQGGLGVGGVAGQLDDADGGVDAEALALLAQRLGRAHERGGGALGGHEHAELVAAHPERAADALDGAGEAAAEVLDQHVAGDVAEDVVVGLEAVEVEQRELPRAPGRGLVERVGQRAHQRAAVAEPGQRVGQRLVARALQQAGVLAQAHREPQHEQERDGEREVDRGRAQRLDLAVPHEHAERGERERGGQADVGAAHRSGAAAGLRRQRGGAGEHERGQRGAHLDPLEQAGGVGDRAQREAGGDEHERAARAAPEQRGRAGGEAQQQDVAERVGERAGAAARARRRRSARRPRRRRSRRRATSSARASRARAHAAAARGRRRRPGSRRARTSRPGRGTARAPPGRGSRGRRPRATAQGRSPRAPYADVRIRAFDIGA